MAAAVHQGRLWVGVGYPMQGCMIRIGHRMVHAAHMHMCFGTWPFCLPPSPWGCTCISLADVPHESQFPSYRATHTPCHKRWCVRYFLLSCRTGVWHGDRVCRLDVGGDRGLPRLEVPGAHMGGGQGPRQVYVWLWATASMAMPCPNSCCARMNAVLLRRGLQRVAWLAHRCGWHLGLPGEPGHTRIVTQHEGRCGERASPRDHLSCHSHACRWVTAT